MNELTLANNAAELSRLKSLALDSAASPITKRVYNLGLDEFIAWYGQEPRPGFTKATVAAWRVALEVRDLASVCGLRRCGSWRWRRPTMGCWRRNWLTESRG